MSLATHWAQSEDSGQTAQVDPSLCRRTCHVVGFVMMRFIFYYIENQMSCTCIVSYNRIVTHEKKQTERRIYTAKISTAPGGVSSISASEPKYRRVKV